MDEEPRPIRPILSKKEDPVVQNLKRSPSQSSIGRFTKMLSLLSFIVHQIWILNYLK